MDRQDQEGIERGSGKRKASELDAPAQVAESLEKDATKRARSTESNSLDSLLFQAEANDPQAQYELGIVYSEGKIIPADQGKEFAWLQKAAEQGHAVAQAKLGFAYAKGIGVVEDITQAVFWFRKAADQGYADAQFVLGQFYEEGWGIEVDRLKAVNYYIQSNQDQALIKLRNILGPLKRLEGGDLQALEEKMQHITEIANELILVNDLKAGPQMAHLWHAQTISPELSAMHRRLSDFGAAVLKILPTLNLTGFMVEFEHIPAEFNHTPNHELGFFRAYPSFYGLACFGKESVKNGDLMYQLLRASNRRDSINDDQINVLASKRVKEKIMIANQLEANIILFDTLIRTAIADSASDQEIFLQEILKQAESYKIAAEEIMPVLSKYDSQHHTEANSTRLIDYLGKKAHYDKALQDQKSSLEVLNQPLLEAQDSTNAINYNQTYALVRKRIKKEMMAAHQLETKILKFDALIRTTIADSESSPDIYHREILKQAQSYRIVAEKIMPILFKCDPQYQIAANGAKLIDYLANKVHYEKALRDQNSSIEFLNQQLAILDRLKDKLSKLLLESVHLRNQRLLEAHPQLGNG